MFNTFKYSKIVLQRWQFLSSDIDECENATLFDCQEHSTCVNLDGSYTCDCDPGYMKQGDLCGGRNTGF